MNWVKKILIKLFRSAFESFIQEALDKATLELSDDLDRAFPKEEDRRIVKSGIELLKQRLSVTIRERLK